MIHFLLFSEHPCRPNSGLGISVWTFKGCEMCGILAYLGCMPCLHCRHEARELSSEGHFPWPTRRRLLPTRVAHSSEHLRVGRGLPSLHWDSDETCWHTQAICDEFITLSVTPIFVLSSVWLPVLSPLPVSAWISFLAELERSRDNRGGHHKGKGEKSTTDWPPKTGNDMCWSTHCRPGVLYTWSTN